MLSVFISIPVVAFAALLVWRSIGQFRLHKAGWGWWTAFTVLFAVGAFVGFRLAGFDLKVSPTFRWVGLPLPVAFFQLEGERWTDFIPPPPIQCLNALADIFLPVGLLLGLMLLTWRWSRRGGAINSGANPQGGANGSQPSCSEQNTISAAAGSRRSP